MLGPVIQYLRCSEPVTSVKKRMMFDSIPMELRGSAKVPGMLFLGSDGCLCKARNESDEVYRVSAAVVPKRLTRLVLIQYHDSEVGAHLGRHKTLGAIRAKYWWPSIEQDVRQHVKLCKGCMLAKLTAQNKHGFQLGMTVRGAFEDCHVDSYGPFPATACGFRYAITCVEAVTGYGIAFFVADLDRYLVATGFYHHWIAKFGAPKRVISDRGTEYANSFWSSMLELCGIKGRLVSTYNPRANSKTERGRRTIRPALAIAL